MSGQSCTSYISASRGGIRSQTLLENTASINEAHLIGQLVFLLLSSRYAKRMNDGRRGGSLSDFYAVIIRRS